MRLLLETLEHSLIFKEALSQTDFICSSPHHPRFSFYSKTSWRSPCFLPLLSLSPFSSEPTQTRHLPSSLPKLLLSRSAMTSSLLNPAVILNHLILPSGSLLLETLSQLCFLHCRSGFPLSPMPFLLLVFAGVSSSTWPLNFVVT